MLPERGRLRATPGSLAIVSDAAFTRCARPHLTARRISTYTILGWVGYAVANLVGSALALRWQLTLGVTIIAFVALLPQGLIGLRARLAGASRG